MVKFIFCVHNHQPVGNFDSVIEEAFVKSYDPFLKRLYNFPNVKFSYHSTGYLLDWLVKHKPAYIEMLREMCSRGQVEIMGGGYYEPVLAVIPFEDRIGQLNSMSGRIEELFGKRPRGIWLAERVWDPTLPTTLVSAGLEYVVVDDYHFIKSGLKSEELTGRFITEDVGDAVTVFPGSERLRYLLPFDKIEALRSYFDSYRSVPEATLVFADDGEKFGVWPNTYGWVYEQGWMDSFLGYLSSGEVKTTTFASELDDSEPLGRVYLPTTSYMEMGEWALPPDASREYALLREQVSHGDKRILKYMQGGTWRNFFSKYPEADWLHKRMLMASSAVAAAGSRAKEVVRNLYMSQSNDPYWHGVFGGLYLPHLRTAAYENIIKAENAALPSEDGVTMVTQDFDCDSHNEALLRTKELNVFLSPRNGGTIVELDFRPKAVNLSNTLTRWREGYHEKLKEASGHGGHESGSKSIHDMVLTKEAGLHEKLKYDAFKRASLRNYFLSPDVTLEKFSGGAFDDIGGFASAGYESTELDSGVELKKKGRVLDSVAQVVKSVIADASTINVDYKVETIEGSGGERMFAIEFNLITPGCNGPVCGYGIAGVDGMDARLDSRGSAEKVSAVSITDGFAGVRVSFELSKEARLWRYPIETVSLSEAGFERIYQGSSLVFLYPFKSGEVLEFSMKVTIHSI